MGPKVLFISRRYFPEIIGGGQISAHAIAQAAAASGCDVRVLTFTSESKRRDEVIDGIRIARFPIKTFKHFPRFSNLEWMYYDMGRKALEFIDEFKPDVLHALNGESIPSAAYVKMKTGIPFVATINGPIFCFPGEGIDRFGNSCELCKGKQRFSEVMRKWGVGTWSNKLKAFLYWVYSYPHLAVYFWSLKRASKILAVSTAVQSMLIKKGFQRNQVCIVHNPMDVHQKAKSKGNSEIREKLGIAQGDRVLLYAGRIAKSKGVQNIISILPEFEKKNKTKTVHKTHKTHKTNQAHLKTHLIVAGRGAYLDQLKLLTKQKGVESCVHFLGFLEPKQLGMLYSEANCVLMVGGFYEALGRMLLEACSFGVPVIATDRAGNSDIIQEGVNGFLIPVSDLSEGNNSDNNKESNTGNDKGVVLLDRLKTLLASIELQEKMGKNAQEMIRKKFSSEKIGNQLKEIYEAV